MSVFLQVDDSVGPIQIASNQGYAEFGDWVDSLDHKKYGELVHLYEHGWCQNVDDLKSQISAAGKSDRPTSVDVRDTIASLAEFLKLEESPVVATITDGFGDHSGVAKDYNPDQPRAANGEFGSGGGAAAPADDASADDKTAVKLKYAPPKATLEKIDKQMQLTEEQKTAAAAKLKTLTDNAHMFRRDSIKTLPLILESGRFKSQFETGTSSAALAPSMRSEAEQNGLGTPKGIDPKERSIYGYMHSDPNGGGGPNEATASYGSVKFKFKDSIRDRTTMTAGDSLGGMVESKQAGTPLNAPTHYSVAGNGGKGNRLEALGKAKNIEDLDNFTETQHQGGLSVDDIDTVIIPKRLHTAEFQALKEKYLDPKGIKVEYDKYDTGTSKPVAARPAAAPKKPSFFGSLFGGGKKAMGNTDQDAALVARVRIFATSTDGSAYLIGDGDAIKAGNLNPPASIADLGQGVILSPRPLQEILKLGGWQDPVDANDRTLIGKLLSLPEAATVD